MTQNTVNVGGVWSVFSDCITCGIRYTVPKSMWDKQCEEGGFHKCPNGHEQGWGKGKTQNDVLRRERDRLRQRVAEKDDAIVSLERSNSAQRGQVTKLKNRAKAGVCSCCNRTFANLARHMKSKHPAFGEKKKVEAA